MAARETQRDALADARQGTAGIFPALTWLALVSNGDFTRDPERVEKLILFGPEGILLALPCLKKRTKRYVVTLSRERLLFFCRNAHSSAEWASMRSDSGPRQGRPASSLGSRRKSTRESGQLIFETVNRLGVVQGPTRPHEPHQIGGCR